MDIPQLEAFLKVVTEGGVSRAALSLGKSQSAVSMRIAGLESFVGAPLFQREGSRMVLTTSGKSLLPVAERIMQLREQGMRQARAALADNRTELSVGANTWTSSQIMVRIAEAFTTIDPGTNLQIQVHSTPALAGLLLEGKIEVAFLNPYLTAHVFKQLASYEERCVLVGRPGFQVGKDQTHARTPFLSYTVGPIRDAMTMLQFTLGRELHVVCESNSAQLIRSLVMAGLGIAFLPVTYLKDELKSGELEEIQLDNFAAPGWPVSLVMSRSHRLTPEAKRFVEISSTFVSG